MTTTPSAPGTLADDEAMAPEPVRRVYLDLDGVMADFDAHFPATFGIDHRGLADDAMWETINAHPSYFRDMPPCAGAVEFFRSIEHLRPIILTACPKTNYPHVARQKRAWVREHLSEHVTVLPVMGGRHKPLFMQEPGDILIDDWRKNIDAWNEAQGIGILHRSFEGTAAALRAALATTNAVQPQAVDVTGEAGWRPICEADCEVATIQTFGEVVLKNSHPAWVRDEDGRTYEAVWTVDDRERSYRTDHELSYWWDIEAESPASPVEIYPHPLSEPPATRPAASGDEDGQVEKLQAQIAVLKEMVDDAHHERDLARNESAKADDEVLFRIEERAKHKMEYWQENYRAICHWKNRAEKAEAALKEPTT